MSDPGSTAIFLLFDRSGSMASIKADAEGGMKAFIEDQRAVPGSATMRIAQFDIEYETVQPTAPIGEVEFPRVCPRGMTALLDAFGRSITEFAEELAVLPEDRKPAKVIFVVVTDGYENSSVEWTRDKVFQVVSERTNNDGWEFFFLAAGQDAIVEGAKLGVSADHSLNYSATGQGVTATYSAASAAVTRSRSGHSSGFTEAERRSTR